MKKTLDIMFELIDACQTVEEVEELYMRQRIAANVFWKQRQIALSAEDELERQKALAKCRYINEVFASSVPVSKKIQPFTAPHVFNGIAISARAKIGKGRTIFQNVTIGSNTLIDSKNAGFPIIGENCYIGAGANIIGNVKIGNNVRVGVGCTITVDVPDNATVVQSRPTIIKKVAPPDNTWYNVTGFLKHHSPNKRKDH